jgi:hypothetical protein
MSKELSMPITPGARAHLTREPELGVDACIIMAAVLIFSVGWLDDLANPDE